MHGGTLAPQLPMSMRLITPVEYATAEIKRMQAKLSIITVTKKVFCKELFWTLKELEHLKKLVLVLATSAPMTDTSRKATFERAPCIWYLVQLRRKNDHNKDKDMTALINLSSKVNVIHFAYITKLGLCAKKIGLSTQKIDRSHLDIFGIVIVDCSVKNKLERVQFF